MHCSRAGLIYCCLILMLFPYGALAQEDTTFMPNDSLFQKKAYTIFDKEGLQKKLYQLDFKTVDAYSYRLYLRKDWKDLYFFGQLALMQGIDYYYLRVRVGIAAFELQRYRAAIQHFRAALKFNEGDDLASSYLYACYQYSERSEDAKSLSKKFSKSLAESMKSDDFSTIDYISVDLGYKYTPDWQFNNPLYLNMGLAHSVDRRVFLFHNFSYFTQQERRFKVDQFQYYLRANFLLKKDFVLSTAFHLINVNSTPNFHDTIRQGPPGTNQTKIEATYEGTLHTAYNYIGSAALTKRVPFFDLSIGATVASFDTVSQYQANAGLLFYPFKNSKFSLGTWVYLHYEDFKTIKNQNSFAFSPLINAYLTPKIHMSVAYFTNIGSNITEGNGYFVSNSVDYTTRRFSVTGSVKLNSLIWIYGVYGFEQKAMITKEFDYNYQIATFGLKVFPHFK